VAASLVYLVVLAWANAWLSARGSASGWRAPRLSSAMAAFYYHYFSTETRALRSLLAVARCTCLSARLLDVDAAPDARARTGTALIPALIAASLAR
jgi:hypothetical protein